ncbi:superoxide dismutase [Parvularcula sp. ZS-1/3]|uniref:Superoxide dismutase n=1 Tax=Parvularcula mediterranea TaxID=2732508 RepID=A0A7Y3RMP8_9PROT|nr:superoxide dismutase [Parvularcula mediterranea]NNU16918.1 superoxide dismutase [Parvularcula mediterranea]
MAHTLPPLPYERDALAPHISQDTLDFHYGKHHQAYVDKMNAAIEGTDHANADLEDIVKASSGSNQGLFNNAAQVWNHTFYWNSMKPNGGGEPAADSKIGAAIKESFGSYDAFKKEFTDAGATQFGSGWAWLVSKGGKLEVRKTLNAETPLTEEGVTPLLTMDVWEHAYYLDYQNARPTYMNSFLDNLVNWDFAEENLAKA